MNMKNNNILEINNLNVGFKLDVGLLKAVSGVDLSIKKNSILGLIGESGCGKSMTAFSILRIIPNPGRITKGEILSCIESLSQKDSTSNN